jgi:hypothetical protein
VQAAGVRATCVSPAGQVHDDPSQTSASQPPPGFWQVVPSGAASPQVPLGFEPSLVPPHAVPTNPAKHTRTNVRSTAIRFQFISFLLV